MEATQVYVAGAVTAPNIRQRWLSSLLMGREQQYVFSKVLPTSDASYLLFTGFLTSGYHTGLMMAKLPPFPGDGDVCSGRGEWSGTTFMWSSAMTSVAPMGEQVLLHDPRRELPGLWSNQQ